MNGEMIFGGVANNRDYVVHRSGTHDAEGPQLVDTGVGRIELREDVVAANLASHESAQVLFNSLLVWVHRKGEGNFGLRNSDYGFGVFNPQSAIRNPQSTTRY
jgi:hypothetical protein